MRYATRSTRLWWGPSCYAMVGKAVKAAFAELRKTGLLCRMGGKKVEDAEVKKAKARGSVYFEADHSRDARERGNDLYVSYGTPDRKGQRESEWTTAWECIAWQAVATLRKHGLVVEYSGRFGSCVVVKTEESYYALEKAREAAVVEEKLEAARA